MDLNLFKASFLTATCSLLFRACTPFVNVNRKTHSTSRLKPLFSFFYLLVFSPFCLIFVFLAFHMQSAPYLPSDSIINLHPGLLAETIYGNESNDDEATPTAIKTLTQFALVHNKFNIQHHFVPQTNETYDCLNIFTILVSQTCSSNWRSERCTRHRSSTNTL